MAIELFPPTIDHVVISHFINSLSDIQLPTAGNDLSAAITLAKQSLLGIQNHRRLLILTDGDIDQAEQTKVSTIFNPDWENTKIQTRIIGFGESTPVTVPNRVKGLVEYQNRPVLSKLEA